MPYQQMLDKIKQINLKKTLQHLALFGVLCVLLAIGFRNTLQTQELYRSISLRYNNPLEGTAAYQARVYAIENDNKQPFWPTFWNQKTAAFETDFAKKTVPVITYSGDASLVWQGQYLAGSAPGVKEALGVAISSELAWTLYGNHNIIGKTVMVDEEERIIRGVFADSRDMALVSFSDEDTSQTWTAVELAQGPERPARTDVESYLKLSGLGSADNIVMGGSIAFFASVLAYFPLFLLCIYALWLAISLIRSSKAKWSRFLPFGLSLLFALFLPKLLDALPPWMIPNRWSDFAFWSDLADQITKSIKEFVGVTPQFRDADGMFLLFRQILFTFAASIVAVIGCAVYHQHYTKTEQRTDEIQAP